jgi:hypothetical protein
MTTTVTTSTADDPLEDLTWGQLFAWYKNQHGLPFVRGLLDYMASKPVPAELWKRTFEERCEHIYTRESFTEAAAELRSVGLTKLATLVQQAGDKRPREIDLCPYEPGTTNAKAWYFREYQKLGLCPWCGSDKSPEAVCDNGERCVTRWETRPRAPRPGGNGSVKT